MKPGKHPVRSWGDQYIVVLEGRKHLAAQHASQFSDFGGLIPEKPPFQLRQENVMVGGVTFADLLREAMDGAGE